MAKSNRPTSGTGTHGGGVPVLSLPTPPDAGDDLRAVDGFAPAGPDAPEPTVGEGETATDTAPAAPPADDTAALKARIAELEAQLAATPAAPPAGKYRVSLKDGPTAVVECKPGEHPFDAFKALTGVMGSINAPEITRAKPGEPVGVVR